MLSTESPHIECFTEHELDQILQGFTDPHPQPMWIRRTPSEDARFSRIISTDVIDRLLNVGGLRPETFRLARTGDIPRDRYLRRRNYSPILSADTIDPELVYQEYHRGASLLLTHAEACVESVHRLAFELARRFRCAVTAHATLTPPKGAMALDTHYDTFDVVILQVEGEKRWEIFGPGFPLPLVFQRYSTYGKPLDDGVSPVLDVVLRPGDMLLLPRGHLHRAKCSESHSLHVAVNLHLATFYDVLVRAVNDALHKMQNEPSMREVARTEGITSRVERLLDAIATAVDPKATGDALLAEMRMMTPGRLRGIHDGNHVSPLDELSMTASVRWETRMQEGIGEALLLQAGNERHWLPRHFESALLALQTGDSIRVELLPGLKSDEALLLARLFCVVGAGRVVSRSRDTVG